tara:strand:+ start:2007 stop:2801 length:795 start_codon:yes stop_codon:yes gene_type:complete
MMTYPEIDPIAFSLGPLNIRWYGVAYVAGILLGWQVCVWLAKKTDFGIKRKDIDDFIPWATLGIVLGGRLGNAIFYHPAYYFQKPWEIFYIWQPGMSFHGGFLGVVLTLILFCHKRRIRILSLGDVISVGTPIGIFFGRLANFINGELYGRHTDVSWAMIFPMGGACPRHPSQLYEAALEGVVLFFILFVVAQKKIATQHPGFLIGLFLTGYGLTRSFSEFFRVPDGVLAFAGLEITLGQVYSLPLILTGILLLWRTLQNPQKS